MPSPAAVLGRMPRFPRALVRDRLVAAGTGPEPGVLLVGPAGSGKTVVAAQIAAMATRAGYVRMTAASSGASDLVSVAASSLGESLPADGLGLLDLAGELLAMLERASTVLVIDEYQAARGEECDPLLAEVIGLLADGSRVVVCGRVRPPGLLGRAADGLLRVIASDELAFTVEEASNLFDRLGRDAALGAQACEALAGWPAGLVLAAEAGEPGAIDSVRQLVRRVLVDGATDAERAHLEALSVLPHLTKALAAGLDLDAQVLAALGARTMLVSESDGYWRVQETARQWLAEDVDAARAREIRRKAAALVEADDPDLAVELLLAAGDHEGAADALSRHLSVIGVDRAVGWLYRLPAELRRQFPPVAAGGKATVDLDEAVTRAQLRVDRAADDATRREALFALGSALAHTGALSSAAAAFESVCAPGIDDRLLERAQTWLAIVRWWAGDVIGARAAVAARDGGPLRNWVAAELALTDDDLDQAEAHATRGKAAAARSQSEISEAPFLSVLARVHMLRGDVTIGRGQAQAAYRAAAEADGFDLAAAAPAHAWCLVNAGESEAALAVADLVERRIGRHDSFARLHVQLIRLAVATKDGDGEAATHAQRRIRDLRQHGFAVVEAQARKFLEPLGHRAEPSLSVRVLGPTRVAVDGHDVPLRSWKSHKAWEVLVYLALAGERGAHREEVIEAVWPERDPDKGRTLLRAALSEIRRRLEPGRPAGESSTFVETTGDRVRLLASVDWDDARALAKQGRAAEALALFEGELAADLPYVEWIEDDRRAAGALRIRLEGSTGAD